MDKGEGGGKDGILGRRYGMCKGKQWQAFLFSGGCVWSDRR